MTQYVYFIRPVGMDGPIKIGCSFWPEERLMALTSWAPFPLEILATLPGDMLLERRFHAHFYLQHSHNEWFRAAPELLETIARVRDGTFDPAVLPAAIDVRVKGRHTPESISAGVYNRRLQKLENAGCNVPREIKNATHTYRIYGEELIRRRAAVREFVDGVEAF